MAAQAGTQRGQVLVNKQFNSPIKLYSPENVADVLNKQTQVLENGAVGIDFHQLSAPGHLANSAVLRMLAEEERQRGGAPKGLKRVAWPPPPDSEGGYIESQPVFSKGSVPADTFAPPRQAPLAWEPPSVAPVRAPVPAPAQAQAQPQAPAPAPVLASPPVQAPLVQAPPARAAPAPAPAPQFQASPAPGQPGQPQYPPPLREFQFPSYQAPVFQPPPSTVVLRPEPPISQAPFPVFESQPAATRAAEPTMRGDEKWPPVEYKERAAVENEQRVALARGPAVRPRKVNRDYSKFFAQNKLTPNYPSYKAPPGTQHYVEEGTSNF